MTAKDGRVVDRDKLARLLVALAVVAVPVWAIYSNWGEPLYETETVTVTKTVHTGFLIDVGNVLLPWLVAVFILYVLASGVMPRGF